jgi:hypothetical protein
MINRSEAEITLEEIFNEFDINLDRFGFDTSRALDVLERSYERVREPAFDQGYEEGREDAGYDERDEAYEEGVEDGRSDATLYDVVGSYLQKVHSNATIRVTELFLDDTDLRIRYRHSWDNSMAQNHVSYEAAEILGDML